MISIDIGVPKEIKQGESRVGLTPSAIKDILKGTLKTISLKILVQSGAGELSGFSDQEYIDAGAGITDVEGAWNTSLVVKVKEPLAEEFTLINDQVIYSFFHWNAPANAALRAHIRSTNAICIPYELIRSSTPDSYYYPCLAPMSAIAGRLAVQKGTQILELNGTRGAGLLLGGIPGTPNAKVAIVGGGVVGYNAATIAIGMGADVTVLDISTERMTYLDSIFRNQIKTVRSTTANLIKVLSDADLVIGAVLIPGLAAPKVITDDILWHMKKGSVIVDVAIDEGGCTSASVPTSHSHPTYVSGNSTFYCVPNMPALVPKTSTTALVQETSDYINKIVYAMSYNQGGSRDSFNIGLGLEVKY